MIIISEYLTSLFVTVNKMCDDNGCCVTVEQPADSIYFMPNRNALMAPSGLHPSRSIGSCYMGSNYIINNNALHLLPPTYDQTSTRSDPRLMLAAAPLTNQPLPPIPQMDYDEAFSNDQQIQRGYNVESGNGAIHRYQIQEAIDSNCNSLDSRGARTAQSRRVQGCNPSSVNSSRHQTPCRERRRFNESINSASSLNIKEGTPQPLRGTDKVKPHREISNTTQAIKNANNSGNIYRGRNTIPTHQETSGIPIMMRNNGVQNRGLPRGVGYLDSLMDMHPNWRQYLMDGCVNNPTPGRRLNPPFLGGSPISSASFSVSSPNSFRRRFD